jgi:multiple sugar transport system substrate-binding protein
MGFNGFFLVGQLNQTGQLDYDIVQPPAGPTGVRSTALSTNGWAIAANSEHKDAAWALLQELTDSAFLSEYWAKPGHSVPARKSAVESIINPSAAPANQQAIVAAMEYAEVFMPFTPSAFEAYLKTAEFFTNIMKGDTPLEEGLAEIDKVANEVLAKDK